MCPICNRPISPNDHECPRCGFRLGGSTESFERLDLSDPSIPALSDAAKDCQYSLYVSKGPQVNEEFYLDSDCLTVGRDPRCDIFLNDMTVSRHHAVITLDGPVITVQDENSLNGTWVDGTIIEETELVPGSILQIGTFTMVLQEHVLF